MADVVVVGAGIVGASVALHLVDGGADVVVVDAGRPGRATLAGAGIVTAPTVTPGSPYETLRSEAARSYPALAVRAGGAAYSTVGELLVEVPGPTLDRALEDARAAHGAGVTELSPGETARLFPYADPAFGAVWIPGTARVDGEAMRTGLLAAAGVEAREVPAEVDIDGVRLGGRLLQADAVVLAAGAWTADLAAGLGVQVPVEPQRGQIAHFDVPDDTDGMPAASRAGSHHYLLTFPDHRVVAGASRETGSGFEPRLTAAGVAGVLRDALDVAPGLASATLRELRVGLRPLTPDREPILGPVAARPGLWLATGMGPSGLLLGPYCGQLVAAAILGRDPGVDLAPFAVERFAER